MCVCVCVCVCVYVCVCVCEYGHVWVHAVESKVWYMPDEMPCAR